MARTDPQLNFRCPADLRDRLEGAAAISGRSLTQEVVARLQASFDEKPTLTNAELQALLDSIDRQLMTLLGGDERKARKRAPAARKRR
jgi:uncharacterized protein (DUF1778 family)